MSVYIHEGELWESAAMKAVFSTPHHLELMQKVEAALATAQAELGIIPTKIAQEINSKATLEYLDLAVFEEQTAFTGGHPVVPFLRAWKPAFQGSDTAEFIHWGATTQDILDTALILKLREVYDHIYGQLINLRRMLVKMAKEHIDTPMAGRTHIQHAIPITFGLKLAVWLMELNRHLERLEDCKKRLFAVSFYGAAGTLASLGSNGLDVTKRMATLLDLKFVPVPWHTARDNLAEFTADLTSISTTFGKIASELYELSRSEVGEVEEPWTYGNVGSSTMPQKRNAFGLEAMVGLSRIAQFESGTIYAAMMHEHERDFRAANVEGYTLYTTCSLTEKTLHYAELILARLDIHPEKMLANLDLTKGLIMSESIMMRLGEKLGRLTAHEKIYDMAMSAFQNGHHLKDLVLADQEIMASYTPEEIDSFFDPVTYIGDARRMVEAALAASI